MALKRQLSQPSPGATPARKAPRLTLVIPIPSSPDPISTAPTVVSPTEDDRVPILPPSALTPAVSRPTPFVQLDPVQLVAQLEELAAEYERSVDDMGAEIAELKRKVRLAERRLEATPSMEDCRVTTSCYSPASRSKQVAREPIPQMFAAATSTEREGTRERRSGSVEVPESLRVVGEMCGSSTDGADASESEAGVSDRVA